MGDYVGSTNEPIPERGECDKEEGESEVTKEQEKTRGGLTSNNEIEQKYADKKSSSALAITSLNRRRCNDLDRCRAADKQGSHFLKINPPGGGKMDGKERLGEPGKAGLSGYILTV